MIMIKNKEYINRKKTEDRLDVEDIRNVNVWILGETSSRPYDVIVYIYIYT